MNREMLARWAATGCRWAIFASIVAAPTQWDIGHWLGGHVTLAEPFILAAAFCWLIRVAAQNAWWRSVRPLPWPVALFVLAAVLSIFMVEREGMVDALRETAKVLEYFVVAYILYDDLLRQQPRSLRTVLYLMLGVTVGVVLLAAVQYFISSDPIHGVVGAFKSRNVLGGWLALLLPVIFGVALHAENLLLRAGLLVLVAGGLLVDLSAASLGAILLLLLLLAATRGWRAFAITALAATCWVAVVTPNIGRFKVPDARAPQNSQQVLLRSIALYTPDGQPERRYPQWQSAAEMIFSYPWLGVGLGNYQRYVEQYTGTRPMPTGPSEPDIQNLYLVIGSTMGLPALFAFFALLLTPVGLAAVAAARHEHWRKGVVCGLAGGLVAFSITAIWHPLLVRGIGLHLVLVLVMVRLLAEWSMDPAGAEALKDAPTRRSDKLHGSGPHRHHRRRWRSPEQHHAGRHSGESRSR